MLARVGRLLVSRTEPFKAFSTAAKQKVVVVSGPTAIGKSDLGVLLAKKYDGEIVSIDTAQFYEHLNIGVSKPSVAARQEVPHHMIGFLKHNDSTTAGSFMRETHEIIKDILSRGKLPILVGGSMFYINWIVYGCTSAPPSDHEARTALQRSLESEGDWEKALSLLAAIDPEYASTIPPNNYQRLSRSLEIVNATGQKMSTFLNPKEKAPLEELDYDYRSFFLTGPRMQICRTTDLRVEEMFAKGLLHEVKHLMHHGLLEPSFNCSKTIGYSEPLEFFSNLPAVVTPKHLDELLSSVQSSTRKYSKRQRTMIEGDPQWSWIQRSTFSETEGEAGRWFLPIHQDLGVVEKVSNLIEMDQGQYLENMIRVDDIPPSIVDENDRKLLKQYVPFRFIFTTKNKYIELAQSLDLPTLNFTQQKIKSRWSPYDQNKDDRFDNRAKWSNKSVKVHDQNKSNSWSSSWRRRNTNSDERFSD